MKVLRADFRKIEALVYTKYLSCMAFTSHDIVSSTKTETTSQSPAGFVFLVTQNCLSMEFFFLEVHFLRSWFDIWIVRTRKHDDYLLAGPRLDPVRL